MPIFKDNNGQLFAIPSKELAKYQVSEEEARKLAPESGRDEGEFGDVELQRRRTTRSSHPWYSGD